MANSQPDRSLPIDRVRSILRTLPANDPEAWARGCNQAIQAAQRAGDGDTVAALCRLAASGLDALGRFEEALARIEFGLGATRDSAQRAQLWLVRATLRAMAGDLGGAGGDLARAERARGGGRELRERIEFETYRAILASIGLEAPSVEDAHGAVAAAQRAGFDWLASGLVTWLVPWLAASGLTAGTRPWIDWLDAHSDAVAHRHRGEDAAAFRYAITVTEGEAATPPGVTNPLAAWRIALAQLRDALLRGEATRALEVVALIEARVGAMNPGFRDGHECFRAVAQAYAGVELARLEAPRTATLVTLPAWLAGAEAVALGGTRAEALRWRVLFEAALPNAVVTALEWPVSVIRMRALLAARGGDLRATGALLEAAAEESGGRQAVVEHALALVQWQELVSTGVAPTRPLDRGSVAGARELLAARGVPWLLHAHAVARVLAVSLGQPAAPRLTAREIEVLSCLEAGLSYREAAERLGVGWRTVQTHAHRIYRKLDVSGRREAIEAARSRRLV